MSPGVTARQTMTKVPDRQCLPNTRSGDLVMSQQLGPQWQGLTCLNYGPSSHERLTSTQDAPELKYKGTHNSLTSSFKGKQISMIKYN